MVHVPNCAGDVSVRSRQRPREHWSAVSPGELIEETAPVLASARSKVFADGPHLIPFRFC